MDSYYNSRNKILYLNLFWIGIIIYILSAQIKGKVGVSQKIGELSQFIGMIIWIVSLIKVYTPKFNNAYIKTLQVFLFIWTLIIIMNGFYLDKTYIKALLLDTEFGIFLYFVPFIALIPKDFTFLKRLFDTIIILGIFYLIYTILFIRPLLSQSNETQNIIEYLARNLGMASGFLLLTYKYHKRSINFLAILVMVISILISIYKGRRGLTITLGSIIVFAFTIYLYASKLKFFVIYITILAGLALVLYSTSIYRIEDNKLLGKISERGTEDTRSVVEIYFFEDMELGDWIFGRGINGVYYSPNIYQGQNSDYRTLIETGFLQIILKGGIIRLLLIFSLLIPAIFLGLFDSNNLLSKASALWILVAIISLYPGTVESFSLQYILVWLSVGICFTPFLRKLSDDQIIDQLNEVVPFRLNSI